MARLTGEEEELLRKIAEEEDSKRQCIAGVCGCMVCLCVGAVDDVMQMRRSADRRKLRSARRQRMSANAGQGPQHARAHVWLCCN